MNVRRIGRLLNRRILRKQNPEDRKRCELNEFVCSRIPHFRAPAERADWGARTRGLRRRILRDVYMRGHPDSVLSDPPKVEWTGEIDGGDGYRIRKLRYEGYPGLWIPGLLYEPSELKELMPAVLNPNGHAAGGKAVTYKQARCINLAKRGMLALSTEFIGMGELQDSALHNRFSMLDLCGRAGVGIFYLAMKRGLDILLSHPHCDSARIAMT